MKEFAKPRRWSAEELEVARRAAIDDFVAGRADTGDESYAAFLGRSTEDVESLFEATANLTDLSKFLLEDARLVTPFRHVAGPAISQDDLPIMANVRKNPKKYREDEAQRITDLIFLGRDRTRFPWLEEGAERQPDDVERRAAIVATATSLAAQRIATFRRVDSAKKQEKATRELLLVEGYTEVERKPIFAIDDLDRGTFCGETRVRGNKADFAVRLKDGRLLLIECKVSNSGTNSVKRLNDIGNKIAGWKEGFGEQAVVMGVIAGVYKLINLTAAQNKGIALVWDRDFSPLSEFLAAAI